MSKSDFIVVTTPTVAGYKIKKVLGMVTGLAPRTRGVGGALKGAFQSLKGGEVSAFTSEIEKARVQAIDRAIEKAKESAYNSVYLDSGRFMTAAHKLYHSFGFIECNKYPETEIPPQFRPQWLFMEKALEDTTE